MLARFFLIVSVIFVGWGLILHFGPSISAAPAPDKARVLVQEMKAEEDNHRLLVPALVEAKVSSLVTAEAEGLVTKIRKPLGSQVKAGEVVLYLKNEDPSFTYATVPVRAPVAGVVSQIMPALMTRVNRGDKLFTVMNPKVLKITAEVPGSELSYLKPGSKGVFKRDLSDALGIPVKVAGISPLVDPRTGTASAELEFSLPEAVAAKRGSKAVETKTPGAKSPHQELPAIGSVGHALFEMSLGKVLLIPESALGYSEGKPVVKTLDEAGLVKRKSVELGEQRETHLVIKGGLAPGDKIIVRANRTVKDGDSVEIESEKTKN